MSKFEDVVTEDTPRLIVQHHCESGTNEEQYQWGIVGSIPILNLIGTIVRIQTELVCQFHEPEQCPEMALVIAWHGDKRTVTWFIHPDIPIDSIVGMLDTIKATITATHKARQMAAQQVILGPDGRPMRT